MCIEMQKGTERWTFLHTDSCLRFQVISEKYVNTWNTEDWKGSLLGLNVPWYSKYDLKIPMSLHTRF